MFPNIFFITVICQKVLVKLNAWRLLPKKHNKYLNQQGSLLT